MEQNETLAKDTKTDFERMEVLEWLDDIGLGAYYKLFIQIGYDSMKSIRAIESKQELHDLGVSIHGHRNVLIEEIEAMKGEKITIGAEIDSNSVHPEMKKVDQIAE